ncbi:pyridoxal phosphate-dependent transferase [Microdochium trichocladiopsis]|uniref:Glutamate decarboxylase n=1 Tax=Microdochium trichocladiopsis TaxID=1682393 RepID=A0A9P9BY16_9PEZI|nr:pyridoxal phosphate-dependent transferase [Microdochium trichocladiopsis]KAH7037603.1 pyridoxal phosphate-dependent transferase [Microdochium trichocladiopsis]
MALARHIDPDDLVQRIHDAHLTEGGQSIRSQMAVSHLTPYSSQYAARVDVPKYKLPEEGAPADAVYELLRDELDLDGKPNLNLASFVGTYMEDKARQLVIENLAKNLSDNDEYPAMMAIHERCISIIAHMWGVQKGEKAIGSATTGSSEAIHLGGLAMKRRWQEARQAAGKDTLKPNIIMGANAQVALEKFARYFDVEARILPVSKESHYRLDPELVKQNIDENTIGVFVILGSTYTGHYEPVEEISKILDEFQEKTGHDIPIHVDAASGGFVAPFTYAQVGGPKWNFELPRVKSINTSGHKFGLVYAGVGWIIWRDQSYLPKHLIFELHYLGGTEESFTLNFSRPGAQVIGQYYNLIHLGFNGYREVMENCLKNARVLSKSLEATGWYTCVSDIHRPAPKPDSSASNAASSVLKEAKDKILGEQEGETSADYVAGLPVVSFRFSDKFKAEYPHIKQEPVSLLMRARQWIIPNYALPPTEEKTEILRVVVRESMSFDLLDRLISDLVSVTQTLMEHDAIDLDILQGTQPPGLTNPVKDHDKRKKHPHHGTKHTGPRLADGIHRAVC